MDLKKLYGTGVALVTPFDKELEVDYPGYEKLLTYTAQGVDYYVIQGTTGESATTSKKEKATILQFTKENNHQNLPLVYGIGSNHTQAVIDTVKETDLEAVDAILSVSPYYNKPSQEGIYQHYQKIADYSSIPIILYNVPGRTASNITAETTLRLAEHPNIIAIKEASGDLVQCMEIMKNKPDDFLLISGDDLLTTSMMSIGAKGVISVLANAFPKIFKEITAHALKGEYHLSSQSTFKLLDINPLMYEESNPVGIKESLNQMGICENYVRPPLLSASDKLKNKIDVLTKLAIK